MLKRAIALALFVPVLLCPLPVQSGAGPGSPPTTTRVSVPNLADQPILGVQGINYSSNPAISSDGRFVAFDSFAPNLVVDDHNGYVDIFVHDRETEVTELVSVHTDGTQGDDHSFNPAISGNGRFVAFESDASNLVTGVSNNWRHIYVYDRQTGTTDLVSVTNAGANGGFSVDAAISEDGRFVAYSSAASIYVRDRQANVTELISVATSGTQSNSGSFEPSISSDGRFVAFHTEASNLVAGDLNGKSDVFLRDRQVGTTERVSINSHNADGNDYSGGGDVSPDGRFVVFNSLATNLAGADTNNATDVFVRDRLNGVTEIASVDSQGNRGNGLSSVGRVAANGRFVLFRSYASNLVTGDNNLCQADFDPELDNCHDVFMRDRVSGVTALISLDGNGNQVNDDSLGVQTPAVVPNGLTIAFGSNAPNVVSDDTNNSFDVFVRALGDEDGDGEWDPFDFTSDSDGDLIANPVESICASSSIHAMSRPERTDTTADDDGDTLVNEPLPPRAAAYDCDSDGYVGTAEGNVATSDQDPCGGSGWPSDLVSGGFQPNALNIQDLGSYLTPLRRFGTSPGHPNYHVRWDLAPGGTIGGRINLSDVAAAITGVSGYPPMFGGLRAFGKTCPWAP